MKFLVRTGEAALRRLGAIELVLAVVTTVARLALRPRNWPRTVRNVLARQILFTGVDAVGLIVGCAIVAGMSIVLQAQVWLAKVGQKELVGPLLVVVIVRELAPLIANFVVIIRSASAIAAEMANMKLSGEVKLLDAQGLDPIIYLVMPRVVGMAICTFGLAVIFAVVSLWSGYMFGLFIGAGIQPGEFVDKVLASIGVPDMLNLIFKSVLPAILTATICCTEGFGVAAAATEIPRATSRGLARSVTAMFIVAAGVSMLTYL